MKEKFYRKRGEILFTKKHILYGFLCGLLIESSIHQLLFGKAALGILSLMAGLVSGYNALQKDEK
jgi:hypothetical protein